MDYFSVRFAVLFCAVLCCTGELEAAFTPPPPPSHGEHSFFSHNALLSHLGFHELAALSEAWLGPSTIFAPSDDSLRTCFSSSVPILLSEHVVPGLFTIDYLRELAFGTRIETLSPGRCITVTAESNTSAPKIFIGGVEIKQPDLFNNGMVVVHGIQGFVSPLSCDDGVQRMTTSLNFPLHPDHRSGHHLHTPAVHTTIMLCSNLALDLSFFSGSHSYISNLRCHTLPNHYLTIADLVKLPAGTALPTLSCSWLLGGGDPYVTGVAHALLPSIMDITFNVYLGTCFILLFIAYQRGGITILSGFLEALKYLDTIFSPSVKVDHHARLYRKTRTFLTRTTMLKHGRKRARRTRNIVEEEEPPVAPRTIPRKSALLIGAMYVNAPDPKMKVDHSYEEVTNLRDILTEKYGFEGENITILSDCGGFNHPTRDAIEDHLNLMLKKAIAGDVLFLYVAAHCYFLVDLAVPEEAIITTDEWGLRDEFWSSFIKKVPYGAVWTILVNTCYAGCFFKAAKQEGRELNRGDVVVFPVCEEDESTKDGQIYFDILEPMLNEAPRTNLKFYRKLKKQREKTVLPFYCPYSQKYKTFLEFPNEGQQ
ncbi:hypothetical protein OROGR_002338 [Orobanche gracilis]